MTAPWLFLAVSLFGAWFTFNGHRPIRGGGRWPVVSFAAGWLTTELALHHIAWQAVATLVFVYFGALSAWPGWVGLAVTAASWTGLLATQRQAARARAVCEDALQRAFGPDYFERIRPELKSKLTGGPARPVDWKQLVRPFSIRRPTVDCTKNIPYGRGSGKDLHLDVFRNKEHPTGCPVLFQVHGGAWIMGSKDEQALPLMNQLAEMGWVCVSANYRLSPHATFPDHLVDLKRALTWVREHIAEYGGDPGFVAVTGGSAGGHLCTLMALTQNDPQYQPGFETADTSVSACLPYYGVYDFTNRNQTRHGEGMGELLEQRVMKGSMQEIPEAWHRASPISCIDEKAPPFFIIHGQNDTLVPVVEARSFERALREKSAAPCAYAELEGAQHAFEIFLSLRTVLVNDASCRFLALIYSQYLDSRAPADVQPSFPTR